MCGIYCAYKQSRSCQLPFCASPIFHFEIGDFSVYLLYLQIHATILCIIQIWLCTVLIQTNCRDD